MDIAGLTLAIATIPTLFQTCFDLYDKIHSFKNITQDLSDFQMKLHMEETRVKLIKTKYDLQSIDKNTEPLMELLLTNIKNKLQDITEKIVKYINVDTTGGRDIERGKAGEGLAFFRLKRRTFQWVALDKTGLNEQLATVQHYTNVLYSLAINEADKIQEGYLLGNAAISPKDGAVLSTMAAAIQEQYPGIAKAAKVKQLLMKSMGSTKTLSDLDRTTIKAIHNVPVDSIHWRTTGGLSQVIYEEWSPGMYHLAGVTHGEHPVIVEWRGALVGSKSDSLVNYRLDALCELLCAMHIAENEPSSVIPQFIRTVDFKVLKCLGWTTTSKSFDHVGLVFECPQRNSMPPKSLLDTIKDKRRARKPTPPLGHRFNLAFGVCNAIANIIAIGWVHRAVRSENMLIFGEGDIRNVYLVGFTYSRPDNSEQEFSNLPARKNAALYRPHNTIGMDKDELDSADDEKRSSEQTSTELTVGSPALDIYGLGIVLLEIGLWATVDGMVDSKNATSAQDFQTKYLPDLVEQLSPRCGEIYRDVVALCLNPENWLQESLKKNLAGILNSLAQCRA